MMMKIMIVLKHPPPNFLALYPAMIVLQKLFIAGEYTISVPKTMNVELRIMNEELYGESTLNNHNSKFLTHNSQL
jgi:hypothetical protein